MRKRDGGKLLVDAILVPTKDAPMLQKMAKEMDVVFVPKQENISTSNPTCYKSVPPIESPHKKTHHPESDEQKPPRIHCQCEMIEKPESFSTKSLPLSSSSSPSSKVWKEVSQVEKRSRSNSSSNIHSFATPAESQGTSLKPKSTSKNVQEKVSKSENRSAPSTNETVQTVPKWKQEFSPDKDFQPNQTSDSNDTHQPQITCENCLTREATKAANSNAQVKPTKSELDTGAAPLRSLEEQQSRPSTENGSGSLPQDPKDQSLVGTDMPASESKDQDKESENVPISDNKSLNLHDPDLEENQGQNETENSLEEDNQEIGNLDAFKTTEPVTKEKDDTPNKDFEPNQMPDYIDSSQQQKTCEICLATQTANSNVKVKPASLEEDLGNNGSICFCQGMVKVGDLHQDDIRGTCWRIIERKTKKVVYRKK